MKLQWVTPVPSKSFIPKLRKRTSEKTLELAQAVWTGVVERTPVGSGELRASWNLSLGAPNYQTVGAVDSSPGPSGAPLPPPTLPNIQAANLRNARYFVANGKTYAGYVEFGSPTTAPSLMLERAVRSVDL